MELRPGAAPLPLAADWTAPYARLLAAAPLTLQGRTGLLRAFSPERQGLFLLEPFDPVKPPLVMVHGLGSSPAAWRELTNAVFGDPALRARFQVWHYFYPTGAPYLWAASEFRRVLRATLDATDPGTPVVAVGHSMGGLLLKASVSHVGSALWDEVFDVPPEQLDVSSEDRAQLEEIFRPAPMERIVRAIFVMTPHRGSDVATSAIGSLGDWLVSLPDAYRALFQRVSRANEDVIRPPFRDLLLRGGPSSVAALGPTHPILRTLAEQPIAETTRHHTVAGDIGDGSDGVVRLESALLESAETTAIVPDGHQELVGEATTQAILTRLREPLNAPVPDTGRVFSAEEARRACSER